MKLKLISISLAIFVYTFCGAQKHEPVKEKYIQFSREMSHLNMDGKTDSIRIIADKCLEEAVRLKSDSLLTLSYDMLGNYFSFSGDFPSALTYCLKALRIAEENKFKSIQAEEYSELSWIFYQIGDYENGKNYGIKSVDLFRTISVSEFSDQFTRETFLLFYSNANDNLGNNLMKLNQPDSALECLQSAYRVVLKMSGDLSNPAKAYQVTDMAKAYELLKDSRMAENLYKEALYLEDSIHLSAITSYTIKYYGGLLLVQKRYNEVQQLGKMGFNAALQLQNKWDLADNAQLLQQAYDSTGNKDSAYYYARMVINYKDSVYNTQKMTAIQNAVFKRQVEEKEALQQQENEEEQRKHNLQYVAIVFGIISFLIIFLLLSHSIIAHQKLLRFLGVVALLIVFEFINLYIHPYLSNITNDAPLWMLLVMVCIAALLVPLHHKLEQWVTHKLVEKNNRIRLAAAKKTIEQLERKTSAAIKNSKDI